MPRPIWSGSLSFGLVNVPVEMTSAVRDMRIHLKEVHATRRVPLRRRRVCTLEDVEVPVQEIAHGVQLDGEMVMLTDEELLAAAPRSTKTIEISGFAPAGEIDPVFYERSYWLAPKGADEGPVRAYHLLVDAMSGQERVALGNLVLHGREHPVAIRARERRLLLSTMLFEHEIRPVEDLEIPAATPVQEAVHGAVAVIQELSCDFHPERFHDRNRRRLQALIERKSRGLAIEQPPAAPEPEPAPDLLGALQRSLEEVRSSGYTGGRGAKRKPASAKPSGERGARPRGPRRSG